MREIGIACTGGGVKSVCSLGVIKAFEELGIEISAISGTSIGSCIAVLYAAGYTINKIAEKMKQYAIQYPKFSMLDKILAPFKLIFRGGGKNPKCIYTTIDEAMRAKNKRNMEDFDIPVFIPALDITTKETVYYSSKPIKDEKCYVDRPIAEAVKSTSSLPLLFLPNNVMIEGELHQFSDGGMTNNMPTTHLEEFSNIVVGIEVIYHKKIKVKKVNLITGIRNTFQAMRRSAIVWQRKATDVWIQIDTKEMDIIGGEKEVEECIQKGYETVMNLAKEGKLNSIMETKKAEVDG